MLHLLSPCVSAFRLGGEAVNLRHLSCPPALRHRSSTRTLKIHITVWFRPSVSEAPNIPLATLWITLRMFHPLAISTPPKIQQSQISTRHLLLVYIFPNLHTRLSTGLILLSCASVEHAQPTFYETLNRRWHRSPAEPWWHFVLLSSIQGCLKREGKSGVKTTGHA